MTATWVGRLRSLAYRRRIQERSAGYAAEPSRLERAREQLDRLNAEWARILRSVPRIERLAREAPLPALFSSLEEFSATVPVMTRQTLKQDGHALTSRERPPDFFRITGGSTAEPVQIPAWKSELDWLTPDMWAARGWYGVEPTSRLFMLWGHSHLLGSGWRGWLRGRQRQLFDRLVGYQRFSAYDLSPEALRQARRELERFRPDYVIGYSVALDLFARAVPDARSSLRALGVRLVIAAAEGFPSPDSETRISDLFGCPVAMEYGAVETNLVAHTHPEGGYRAFWRSYLLEAEEVNGRFPLRITSLYPRCTPLLRYEIGDEIDPWPDAPRIGLSSFRRVIGRCNDYVVLGDGRPIHSEAFTHAVRSCAAIRAYQVLQTGPRIELRVLSERELAAEEEDGVRERLGKIEPALARIEIVRSEALERTIAGKTPMILRRP